MNIVDVAEYYDDFIAKQQKSGINDRIYHLYKKLLSFGLRSNSNVLELGCGIGTLTFLISRFVKKGRIEAVDLSSKSIEFAKQRIKNRNINFFAADVVSYQPSIKDLDFITLFDIIEHIPMEKHNDLFRNLSMASKENTKILINIPNPAYIEYDRIHNPQALQIIDQPLPLSFILDNLEKNGLVLTYFKTYSIWVENDYQFFVVEKKKEFREVSLSSKRTVFQKTRKKLERVYSKIKYNYP
jgi:trans-aconitate 2-methyltransferase